MRALALILVGSRTVNKRTARFAESLRDSGFDPVLLAVPRRAWGLTSIEDPSLVAARGFVTVGPAGRHRRLPRRAALVVCMHWSLLPLALALKLVIRARVIYDEHDHYELLALESSGPEWSTRIRSWCVGRVHALCLSHVDVVTCIRMAGGLLKRHLEARATTVVELHNYPSRRWGVKAQDRSPSDGSIALVYVGGIWEEKGCRSMLDAFLLVDDVLPRATLHAFGRGDPALERDLDAAPGVIFHGATPFEDIVAFLAGNDCLGLVLLDATPRYSLYSTNSHKLFEYAAAGASILVTEVGEIGDLVTSLDCGWTIAADVEARELAAMLRQILADPREIRRRGDAGAEAVEREALWWDGEWRKLEPLGVLELPDHV